MKKQTILKSMLCLLMALVCNVAWADLTGTWTSAPTPWSEDPVTELPKGLSACDYTAGVSDSNPHTIHMASREVSSAGGTATITFTYTTGNHMLMIAGVDLVNSNGEVAYHDYHEGKAGGQHVNNVYTLTGVAAGQYTLRYFVCNKASGNNSHNITQTNGKIAIVGLDVAGSAEEIAIANAANANANIDIHGLQQHYGLVQDAGTGIAGDGQFVCNYPAGTNQESGNAYANMIDGNYDTFFHSGYDGTIGTGKHYLQASLTKPVKSFRFYFKKRKQNNNNRPTNITIEGSNDKDKWTEIKVISGGFPTDGDVTDYFSEVITSDVAYQHLRFTVNNTNTNSVFFTFSEFYILPNYAKVEEVFNAVRNYRGASTVTAEIANALIDAHKWNIGLAKGTPIVGVESYIYADTYKDGAFLNRYLYNKEGSLSLSTQLESSSDAYVWTPSIEENGKYTIENKVGKYLAHKGMSDNKHEFTVAASTRHAGVTLHTEGSNYFVIHNADGKFDQSKETYDQTTKAYCTDFVFVPADLYQGLSSVSIVANTSEAKAVFAWNGFEIAAGTSVLLSTDDVITDGALKVKSCNPAFKFEGFYSDKDYANKITELTQLTGDITVYAKFDLAVFSEKYGDMWVNIVRASNANHAAILGGSDKGTIPTFNTLDYANGGMLWCLVGNAESFKIYNKVSGEALALTPSNTPADGVTVEMTTAADAQSWHIINYSDGYAIAPVGNNAWGINSYTGSAGSQIKFYGVGDGGTHWNFVVIDATKPLSFSVNVDKIWKSSPRVAELTFTVNGETSQTRILNSIEGQKLYYPVGTTFSVSSMTYRGYTFNGFGNGVESYEKQTIPEGGLDITASYTANDERTLFYSPRDGHPYRIPAIATATNGDVFAICDYRPCGNDIGYGEVDLVCRVSSDNGVTWTEERTIADGQGDAYAVGDTAKIWQVGFGDPAIVADRESNKVLVMSVCGNQTCWDGTFGEENPNPNRVARLYIEHDGEKWVYGEPEEITYSIYPKFVDKDGNVHAASLFIGAGKICQSRVVKKGDYYRLYCAVWNVTKTQRQHHNYVIYSDDFGQTWEVLGDLGYENSASKWGNEPKCEELPDGTVVLSSRKYNGRYFNLFKFDNDTYTTGTWLGEVGSNEVQGGLSFGGNSTNGEIYKVKAIRNSDEQVCDLMFQSIPTGNDRSNVAIYYKEMEYNEDGTNMYTSTTFAQGWTKGKHVSQKESCYSTMILQADGRIAFFFEEVPGGYSMVYIPYTIEELTGDEYTLYTEKEEGEGGTTSLENVETTQPTVIYDLQGRRVANPTKGVYIVGGRKVIK